MQGVVSQNVFLVLNIKVMESSFLPLSVKELKRMMDRQPLEEN